MRRGSVTTNMISRASHSSPIEQVKIPIIYSLTAISMIPLVSAVAVVLCLGDAEKEHGLTFVALSRSTDINNVFLGAGCSLERITSKISNGFKLK